MWKLEVSLAKVVKCDCRRPALLYHSQKIGSRLLFTPKSMEHQFPFCFILGASGKHLSGIDLPSSLSRGSTAYSSGELSLLPVSKSPAY
jgi:hypothetical protein